MIADGRKIIIIGDQVLKVDAWVAYHPGGDISILHFVGRDAKDEITAFHSEEAQAHMQRYVIGRVDGRWENLLPPIQGGVFRALASDNEAEADLDDTGSSGQSTASSLNFDSEETRYKVRQRSAGSVTPVSQPSSSEPGAAHFKSAEASTAHAISSDFSNYPHLDQMSQHEVIAKYRQLDEKLRFEGLYQCRYSSYAVEFIRYSTLFALFLVSLHYSYYALSGLFLGSAWHLLSFLVHDAGHLSITRGFHTDTCIGIFVADFIGGLSVGWWKRNHNVHHIATNSPEHDPDIQHMPFFAISSRFFASLRST